MTYKMNLGLACTLCGDCVDSCPTHALQIKETLEYDPDSCQYCEVCSDVCEECAIRIEEVLE